MSDDKDERTKARAYKIWEEEGRPQGRHDEHWHRAVQEGTSAGESGSSPPYPGMMGDGTEEQNLDQPGDPKARITEKDVQQAFGSGASGKAGKAKR